VTSTLGPTRKVRVGGIDWQVPQGYEPAGIGRCKGPYCFDVILWTRTAFGNKMPLNQDGNGHWATCPDRDRFKKKGGENL
jgi:hypothetical protein